MDIKESLEEKVDGLLSESNYKSEDLIDLLEKKIGFYEKRS